MRDIRTTGKRTITPQKVIKILEENGTIVNNTEAELILDFMYKFANLSVKQIIRKDSGENNPDVRTPRKLFK
ncbi:hypothetical protein SAMN05421820_11171 [Pedobacter steynii]|uniref:Uncharacterized protein n=1 Tax=Pedobacter steynii TaxID=430522 RepID=A0A1H0G8B5_9SPHI|nr:hypothetical protein [Pedobacter steynii]NQX42351.1 hypothetical protein [Pedobacter steynii]SDO03137.1 hypothetical protein SAMN05421820_11171 [Pedobacter steynii]